MTVREFLFNLAIILTIVAVGALVETAVPMFVARTWRHGRRAANLRLTALSLMPSG
jgi:hypothetical protein